MGEVIPIRRAGVGAVKRIPGFVEHFKLPTDGEIVSLEALDDGLLAEVSSGVTFFIDKSKKVTVICRPIQS